LLILLYVYMKLNNIEIQQLKKENAMLKKDNTALDKLVEKMEYSLGRGEYNPETTRVCYYM